MIGYLSLINFKDLDLASFLFDNSCDDLKNSTYYLAAAQSMSTDFKEGMLCPLVNLYILGVELLQFFLSMAAREKIRKRGLLIYE